MDARLRSWLEGQGFRARQPTGPVEALQAAVTWGQRFAKVGKPIGVVLAAVFAAGAAYVGFVESWATDAELEGAIIEHSASPHPGTAEKLDALGTDVDAIQQDMKAVKQDMSKASKRDEYQFHFSRWQADVIECERDRRCRIPPEKPKRVRDLEVELMTK